MLHFISTGTKFPYSYYLGIMTAKELPLKLWITQTPNSRYFDLIKDKIEIERITDIPDTPLLRKLTEHYRKVAIFDYCMWRILAKEGGTIMGLDSITIKGWEDLLEEGKEILVPRDDPTRPYSVAMHGAVVRKGSKLAQQIHLLSEKSLYQDSYRWGDAGITPYKKVVNENKDKVTYAKAGLISGWKHDGEFYMFKENGKLMDKDQRTMAIYATSFGKKVDEIDEHYIETSNSPMARIVKKKLKKEEWDTRIGKKYRFHLLGLSHLPVSEKYIACAFTQKVVKMAKMLLSLGHEVYLYGSEGSDASCTKFIQTHTLKDIRTSWGDKDNNEDIGYDWENSEYRHDFNKEKKFATLKFYANCIEQINKIKRPDDFLLIPQGQYHRPIYKEVGLHFNCEFGIGYRGSDKNNFRAFESSYLQNFTYGSEHPFKSIDGDYYSRVIPNYFDPKDFTFSNKKKDYYLYIGRIIKRKGVWIAIKATQAIGAKLILVGQKDKEIDVTKLPPHCEYQGFADIKKRKKLMAEAIATFVPTLYLEAFAGTHVESMLSGTPVITTNFAVFAETIPDYLNGKVGFRCNTLQDFVNASLKAKEVDHKFIRQYAERFLMDNVRWEFEKWFRDLYQTYLSIINPKIKGWHYIKKVLIR